MAVSVFLDTSVLLQGIIDVGPQSGPAQAILHAVSEKTLTSPGTAWHCCLEFFSVATRLPPEYRLSPPDAARLLQEEVFRRMSVHDLPAGDREALLQLLAHDRIAGGSIYDVHIGEVARASGAKIIVTDNRKHFLSALRHGIRVETSEEFLRHLTKSRHP